MENVLNNISRRGPYGIDHRLIRRVILNNILVGGNLLQNPILRFDLDNVEDQFVRLYFRFERNDIPRLARALGVPEQIRTKSRYSVTGVEGLCILLRRLSYPGRLCDLQNIFKRSREALSEIINFMTTHIYNSYGHMLEDLEQLLWLNREKINCYAEAIAAKGAAVLNCWGFIDGTTREICRPTNFQEEYYSGHERVHCVKYQSVICPDGIIVSLFEAYPGRRHDAFIFGQSGLYAQLHRKARFPDCHYVIYGDQAYGIRELLLCPYPGQGLNRVQQNFNISMSVVRQAVEWGFQKIVSQFAFLDFRKNQKLLLQDIECMFKTAVILINCHTTLNSSETSQFFNVQPISLEQYLNR